MKLSEHIIKTEEGTEVTVYDNIYDIEVYFYNDEIVDSFDESLKRLSELIETNIEKLKSANLFYRYDIDSIMEDIEAIISGNVSEEWMEEFVNCLE